MTENQNKYIAPYKAFKGAILPNWLMKMELSSTAKIILARLYQYCGKNETAYPSEEKLAEDVGVKPRWVRYCIAELKQAGLIEIIRVGKKCNNRYRFLRHSVMSDRQNTAEVIGSIVPSDRQYSASVIGSKVPVHSNRISQENQGVEKLPPVGETKNTPTEVNIQQFLDVFRRETSFYSTPFKGQMDAIKALLADKGIEAVLKSVSVYKDRIAEGEKNVLDGFLNNFGKWKIKTRVL